MRVLAYCFALLLASLPVMATGIGVAPAELIFSIEEGEVQRRELTVYNLDDGPLEFEVESRDPFLRFQHGGAIDPQGSSKVIVEADAKLLKGGDHVGYVQVFRSNGLDGVQLKIGTVVKARVSVIPVDKASVIVGMALFFSIVILGGLLAYLSSMVVRSLLDSSDR